MSAADAYRYLALCVTILAAACARPPESARFLAHGQPETLDEWHQLRVEDGRLRANDGVMPYALNTPLFSDYAHKLRTVWMPRGASARYRTDGVFEFPIGTVISKTFYYPRADDGRVARQPDAGGEAFGDGLDLRRMRLIETRLLVHRKDGWVALPYVWNDAQTQARLTRGGAMIALTLSGSDGTAEPFDYQVPDQNQCAGCHATDAKRRALAPIGPKARQLNRDVAYADGRDNQLVRWQRAGYLEGAPSAASAPRDPDWTDAHAAIEARARAYLDVNCGHCHSPTGAANTSGLWLDANARDPLHLGRCKLPIAAGKGTGGLRYGWVPARPDESILTYRMTSDDPAVRMPELGRAVMHREGVRLVREWIAMQSGDCDGRLAGGSGARAASVSDEAAR